MMAHIGLRGKVHMPLWTGCRCTVSGYVAGETDFATRVQRLDAAGLAALTAFVARITTAFDGQDGMVAISTIGHSDRVDEAGLSAQQRRDKEDAAADDRAISASAWLRDQLILLRPQLAGTDTRTWRGIAAFKTGAGASGLVFPSPANEGERQANRRVVINLFSFGVSGFPDRDTPEEIDIS